MLWLGVSVRRVGVPGRRVVVDAPLMGVGPRLVEPGIRLVPRGLFRITTYPRAETRLRVDLTGEHAAHSREGSRVDLEAILAYTLPADRLLELHRAHAPDVTSWIEASVRAAFEGQGFARDVDYHQVGRIPVFGSDHRAFAAAGIPAYGLSVVPRAHADALRQFVLSPARSMLMHVVRRPPPFDTYHTSRDSAATVQAAALDLIDRAVGAVVGEMG